MQVGLTLPPLDLAIVRAGSTGRVRWPEVREWARRADGLGFDPLWLTDHDSDPLVMLGALARATSRARLGASFCASRRPPSVLAKALSTVDVVSGGRLVVGVGDSAPELLEETCQVLVGMFGGGPFSFAGTSVQVVGARCLPLPVQRPHPPIWVGGDGDGELDVVARRADGWHATGPWTPETYRRGLDALEAACHRVGRDPATVTRSLRLSVGGRPDEIAAELRRWEVLGVDTVVLEPPGVFFSGSEPEALALLASACSLEAS